MGRFLISVILAAWGSSWTEIPDERINAYMATLEVATFAGTSKVPGSESTCRCLSIANLGDAESALDGGPAIFPISSRAPGRARDNGHVDVASP